MISWEVDAVAELLLRAGRMALAEFGRSAAEVKADGSVVTAADRAIEEMLGEYCDRPEEGAYLLGEESIDRRDEAYLAAALGAEACWVVDPIDGTAPYALGLNDWGVSIGLARRGEFAEGAIYLPASGVLLISDGPRVLRGEGIAPDGGWAGRLAPVSFDGSFLGRGGYVATTQYFLKSCRLTFPNMVFAWGSCVSAIDHLLTGRISGYLAMAKSWDIAGGYPLLAKLGFTFLDPVSGEIAAPSLTAADFRLDAGDPRRWYQRRALVISHDAGLARELAARIEVIR